MSNKQELVRLIGALGIVGLCLISNNPSFAQQTLALSQIEPNPLVEEMLQSLEDGEQIVTLRGYVGPSTPETVRLYGSLSLSSYVEIPRSAILHSVQEFESISEPVTLYIRGSATIVSATRHTASAAAAASRATGLAGAGAFPLKPGPRSGAATRFAESAVSCLGTGWTSCVSGELIESFICYDEFGVAVGEYDQRVGICNLKTLPR